MAKYLVPEDINYVLAAGYQALSFLCSKYILHYSNMGTDIGLTDKILTLYSFLRIVQENQHNTDIATDQTFQVATNRLYSLISQVPYQDNLIGGYDG